MESLPHWPNSERAAHYREQAQKIRALAEAEPPGEMHDQLIAVAEQYEMLARRFRGTSTGIPSDTALKIVKQYRERAAHADDLAKTVSSDEQRRLIHELARTWRRLSAQRVRQLNGPESTFVR